MQKLLNHKSFYIKKWSLDILVDILGGILIALGTYNFASLAQFPMAGPAPEYSYCPDLFPHTWQTVFSPLHPDDFYYFRNHGLSGPFISCL